MENLDLGDNQLTGQIPAFLGNLTSLDYSLTLGGNSLTGPIPAVLGNLTNLDFALDLGRNRLTGEIPAELGNLTNLRRLYLADNKLSGEIPAALGGLTALIELRLDTDTGLCMAEDFPLASPFGRLAQRQGISICSDRNSLETLYHATDGPSWTIDTNWLSEMPLSEWYGVRTDEGGRVTSLNLPSNGLNGEIPASVGTLDYVARVDLSGNPDLCLAPDFPLASPFGREASKDVPVCSNVDREILEALYAATDGPNWQVDTNWMTDEPLSEWHGVVIDFDGRVIDISLSKNGLEGTIPTQLGDLTELEILRLDGNDVVGHIPSELGKLAKLNILYLDDNQLTGQIPEELGKLTELTHLYLYSNELSGPVPARLGNLAKLESLWISFNYGLTGQLPEGLRTTGASYVDVGATNVCVTNEEAWSERIATFWPSGLICGDDTMVDIDVAVFYTPAALREAGGKSGMDGRIMTLAVEANNAYRDSGVHQRLAVVHAEELEYTESMADDAGWDRDLDRLAGRDDDFINEVHDIRDAKGADLVHLIRGGRVEESVLCGLAFVSDDVYDDLAFSISMFGCDDLTFAHELGHNMGLKHDRYSDDTTDFENLPYPYSHGYVNQRAFGVNVTPGRDRGGVDSTCWYTIMAYNDQCEGMGQGHQLVRLFSNPRQMHLGNPLGVTDWDPGTVDGPADAVRSLNAKRRLVADLRSTQGRPVAVGSVPNRTVALGGGAVAVDVASAFRNPSGYALTYQASSSIAAVASVAVSGSRITITPVAAGVSTITVTAGDVRSPNMSVTQTFCRDGAYRAGAHGPRSASGFDPAQGESLRRAQVPNRGDTGEGRSPNRFLDGPGADGRRRAGQGGPPDGVACGGRRRICGSGTAGAALYGRHGDGGSNPHQDGAHGGAESGGPGTGHRPDCNGRESCTRGRARHGGNRQQWERTAGWRLVHVGRRRNIRHYGPRRGDAPPASRGDRYGCARTCVRGVRIR